MKLCISTLVCPNWTLEEIVKVTAACHLDGIDFRGLGVELDITKLPEFTRDLSATVELFRRHNLQSPCPNTSVTLVTPDQAKWETMLEDFRRYVSLAKSLGSIYLRVFGGARPKEMSLTESSALAERHLRELIQIAQGTCLPILETHDEWASSARMMELLRRFDAKETGVLWDIEHPCRAGEKPADTARAIKGYLHHVHFKDGFFPDGKRQPQLLGRGDLPLPACFKALVDVGYDAWLCLEAEKRWHPSTPDPQYTIPQFQGYMTGLMQAI